MHPTTSILGHVSGVEVVAFNVGLNSIHSRGSSKWRPIPEPSQSSGGSLIGQLPTSMCPGNASAFASSEKVIADLARSLRRLIMMFATAQPLSLANRLLNTAKWLG